MADAKQNATSELQKIDEASFDYDKLEAELGEDLADLEQLKADELKISNPESLADAVNDAVWDQFMQQIGEVAGKDFIKENHDMTLDLRDSAHIQTPENFAQGKIAEHNYKSHDQLKQNYDRYKNMPHKQFRKKYVDPGMNKSMPRAGKLHKNGQDVVTDIYTGRKISTKTKLENGKNNPLAAQREHVKPSAELYKDPSLQMANDAQGLADVANNKENLQGYTTAERNNRKSDNSAAKMEDRDKNKHWEKANKRAEEYIDRTKKEGEQRLRDEGRKTQKEEAFRIGGKALRAAVMALLAQLGRNIIQKLVAWFASSDKSIASFVQSVKEAVQKFVQNLKQNILAAGDAVMSTIITSIFGPLADMINRVIRFVKQGIRSIKETIQYFRNPENRKKSFAVQMLEVSKIVIAGLTAAGAIVLGEVIETNLLVIPGFAVAIPLLGSLASIIGMFLGGVVAGIGGAVVLHLIDKLLGKKLKAENTKQKIDKKNHVLGIQGQQIAILETQLQNEKQRAETENRQNHQVAVEVVKASVQNIFSAEQDIASVEEKIKENGRRMNAASKETQEDRIDNAEAMKKINEMLDSL